MKLKRIQIFSAIMLFLMNASSFSTPLLKDPTQPLGANINLQDKQQSKKQAIRYQLQAITYSVETQTAIINGKSYRPGQWLNSDAKLDKVLANSVVLSINDKKHVLSLRKTQIKTELSGAFN